MKKLFILSLILTMGLFTIGQTVDYTVYKQASPLTVVACTLASAGADTVILEVKKDNENVNLCYNFTTYATQISGTSEAWVDIYGANELTYGAFELIEAEDTLVTGAFMNSSIDTDGYIYRYFMIIITAKTQTQSTQIDGQFYIWRRP